MGIAVNNRMVRNFCLFQDKPWFGGIYVLTHLVHSTKKELHYIYTFGFFKEKLLNLYNLFYIFDKNYTIYNFVFQ